MAQSFVPGAARLSFDGLAILTGDPATGTGASYAFANTRVEYNYQDSNGYPDVIDNASWAVNKVPGAVMGSVRLTFVLQPDRRLDQFLLTAFGPRVAGQLPPWILTAIPYSGGAPIIGAGIWWQNVRLYAEFATQGAGAMVMVQLTGMVLDPHNVSGASAAAIPAYAGTAGLGISSFARCSYTNDSGTTYDQIRAFDLALSNGLQVQPSYKDPVNRLLAGSTPGTIKGALTLTQLRGANNAIPQTSGTYPVDVLMPTGDGSKKLTFAGSWSWDAAGDPLSAVDFYQATANYSLFNTSAGSTASGNWPFVTSYA